MRCDSGRVALRHGSAGDFAAPALQGPRPVCKPLISGFRVAFCVFHWKTKLYLMVNDDVTSCKCRLSFPIGGKKKKALMVNVNNVIQNILQTSPFYKKTSFIDGEQYKNHAIDPANNAFDFSIGKKTNLFYFFISTDKKKYLPWWTFYSKCNFSDLSWSSWLSFLTLTLILKKINGCPNKRPNSGMAASIRV